MKIKKIVVSLLSVGAIASPLAHATDGYFSDGYGMKAKGMAGVAIALPQDALAAANNPAGMVMVGNRADVGLDLFQPSRGADVTNVPAPAGFQNGSFSGNGKSIFAIPEFGYNQMLDAEKSVGVSVYGNGGMNTSYANSPFGPNAGINLQQLFIAPTFAMKVNPSNSVGVALNLVYQTFSATGLQAFDTPIQSSRSGSVTNNGTDTSTGMGMKLGWTGELSPMVTMGATYQPKTKMSKFSKYAGLFAEQGGFDIPATYGLGIAVKASPATTIAADYKVIQYSGVASIGNNATQTAQLGANNGSGFGWQDVSVIKLGVSQVMSDAMTLRAGYSHNTQPVQTSQTMFNILAPGVVTDHLTLGATWNVSKQNEVTLAYMHAFEKSVSGPMAGGNANLHMNQNSLGVAYSWKM